MLSTAANVPGSRPCTSLSSVQVLATSSISAVRQLAATRLEHAGSNVPATCSPSGAACAPHSRSAAATGNTAGVTADSRTKRPEMCVIVDENNNVVGSATRKDTVSQRLLGRGSYVLVFDSQGRLFVSRRSLSKDCYPGCLDVTISGVANVGEEYQDTAVRELQEEVSVPTDQSDKLLQHLFIFPYQDDVCHVFGAAFKLVWDAPLAFADAEVEWGRFMHLQELQQQLQQEPEQFTPVGRHILQLYMQWDQQQAQQHAQPPA